MRYTFCLSMLLIASLVLQAAVIPAFLPPVLRPDIGILIGIAVLSFGSREFGLSAVFLLGLNADVLGSARFGLLTLCGLLAAGAILLVAWRELNRGDFGLAFIACVAGTALTHGLYCALGNLIGSNVAFGRAVGETMSLIVAALVWGLPCIYMTGKLMYRLRVMSPEVQARWANDERMNEAHRRQTV